MCYCISIHFLNDQRLILSSSAFTFRTDFYWAMAQDLSGSGQATSSFLQRWWWSEQHHLSEGKRPARPGLGWDVTSRASCLAFQRWWLQGWLETQVMAGGSLSHALLGLSFASTSLSASSLFLLLIPCSLWISTLGQLSPAFWKESWTPFFLQKPLYFLELFLDSWSWRGWSLIWMLNRNGWWNSEVIGVMSDESFWMWC